MELNAEEIYVKKESNSNSISLATADTTNHRNTANQNTQTPSTTTSALVSKNMQAVALRPASTPPTKTSAPAMFAVRDTSTWSLTTIAAPVQPSTQTSQSQSLKSPAVRPAVTTLALEGVNAKLSFASNQYQIPPRAAIRSYPSNLPSAHIRSLSTTNGSTNGSANRQNAESRAQDSTVNTINNKRLLPISEPSSAKEKSTGETNEVGDNAKEPEEEAIEEGEDAGVFCNICLRGESNEDNLIVMCEGKCGLAFHQECYGIHDIPPGDEPWYCDWCAGGNRKSYGRYLYCCHYKNDFSARDLIIGDRETPVHYVHIQCAAWIDHIDTTKIPFKTDVKKVKAEDGRCYFCNARYGGFQAHCCHVEEGIQCKNSFHPMCAIRNRYLAPPTSYSVKYANDYCPDHNPDPDPPNMIPQIKRRVITTDITNTGGIASSPNMSTRSNHKPPKQNRSQARSRQSRSRGSAHGSRTGRSKERGTYPMRTLRRHSMQPAYTMNRISGTVVPQIVDEKVENQTIVLDSDGEIEEPPAKKNRTSSSLVSAPPGTSGAPVQRRITPQAGINNLPHAPPRSPATLNMTQGSQSPFSSPQSRPQQHQPQPHLQLQLQQSAPSILKPVQALISAPVPKSVIQPAAVPVPTLTPPLSSSVAENSTTAVTAVSEMPMPVLAQVQPQIAPTATAASAVPAQTQQPQVPMSYTQAQQHQHLATAPQQQQQAQVTPMEHAQTQPPQAVSSVPTEQQTSPVPSVQAQIQQSAFPTEPAQTQQFNAPGLAKRHTIRIKPFTPGMSPTTGINTSSALLSEDQAMLLKESHGMLENQSTVLRSIQNMVKQMSVSSYKQQQPSSYLNRPASASGVQSGTMGLSGSHLPLSTTELSNNTINNPQQLQALNSTFGVNIPGSIIQQQQHSGVLSSSEMDSLTMQSQLTAAAATAELEEMKANIVYLLKKVNMPQILLNNLMPRFEGQSNSEGSSSDRRGLLQRNKAFKELVDELKKVGSFSKDNVHEYIKIFVRGLEMAEEVKRGNADLSAQSPSPSSPSPSSSYIS